MAVLFKAGSRGRTHRRGPKWYIISHLAAKKSTPRPQFYEIRDFWGGGFDTHPPLRRSWLNLACKTWPLSCCFTPNFSSTGILVWVSWLTTGQSNNAAKFWPWHFTVNVKCGFGNRVFLTLLTMAIRSNTVDGFEQKMPSKVLNSTFYWVDYAESGGSTQSAWSRIRLVIVASVYQLSVILLPRPDADWLSARLL